jgi:hypothetical protein
MTALPQLTSRITHKNEEVVRILKVCGIVCALQLMTSESDRAFILQSILVSILFTYPKEALWSILGLAQSNG